MPSPPLPGSIPHETRSPMPINGEHARQAFETAMKAHARIDAIDPAIAKLKEAVSALERRALAAEAKIEALLAPIVK